MKIPVRIALLGVAAWLVVTPTRADVIFPARLDIAETEPGRYAVAFTLPMVEGRVLRSTAVMPPICRDVTERERTDSYGGLTSTWSVICEPASLAGEAITVEGLLGTQIEIALSFRTLDGRVVDKILRPSRPGFLVPSPPSVWGVATAAIVAGLRWVLGQWSLWVLALVVGLVGTRGRDLGLGVAAFAMGSAVGQFLVDWEWLVVPGAVAESFVLLTAAVPAVALAGGGIRWQGWLRPLWPVSLLIGVLMVGVGQAAVPVDGLARGEQIVSLVLFAAGAALGLAWLFVIALELRASVGGAGLVRVFGYVLGVVATGGLLVRSVGLILLAGEIPLAALSLVVAAVAVAPFLTAAGVAGRWTVLVFPPLR